MRSSASFFTRYSGQQIIIPPRKILKVWQYDNLKPIIYTCGIHENIKNILLIWLYTVKLVVYLKKVVSFIFPFLDRYIN